jgi:two-component system, chemotaxis family, CheB/CheR fusion protein
MPKGRPHRAKAARVRSVRHPVPPRGRRIAPGNFPVVGVGASAGGLEASRKLVGALPADSGMAFILIQHLDPTHESMMVGLLSNHTRMKVLQAKQGMLIERDHIYVIPPGSFLSVVNGALHLSEPKARHGARLPFDFLLHSLATEYGTRAICIVLSGTGTDGCLGLKSIKEKGGLVIVQDPDEAGYDGMPRNAISTGAVDLVLPVAKMPDAIIKWAHGTPVSGAQSDPAPKIDVQDRLPEIIELLRTNTTHDFTLYKQGTLERRIGRRMGLAGIESDDIDRYLKVLGTDSGELELLAKDLLINVTSFFRDPAVFAFLAQKIIPDLIRNHSPDRPLRIWIAGCSTGEEAYSLAMLFREEIVAATANITLQVFASDVDPEAVGSAREGLYPDTIEADVSQVRLARFFKKEKHGYRVSPELRAMVVFTVQDVLADPPFSRLDMVSCRNLLIYLQPKAQMRAISVFHFALCAGGYLLLGNSETVGNADGRFEVCSKAERLYRRTGHGRPEAIDISNRAAAGVGAFVPPGQDKATWRQTSAGDLCQRLVMETFAPAAVLINRKQECLYSLGPTDRYLRVPPGQPTHDLLAMVSVAMRNKLRAAIERASQEKARVVVTGGQTNVDGNSSSFAITVLPVIGESDELFLICFIDEPTRERKRSEPDSPEDVSRVAELERELEAAKIELKGAIRNLEVSGEEQKAINEEALSVNEEFQSTNEELLTSKEELQSLNEELTALNTQLQETLEQQRETSDDLQNILYSTNVATLFLDTQLNIRFFTPATKLLFNIIPSDIGRPLADLHSLSADSTLPADARVVLHNLTPIEREVEALGGVWFSRRILPYRAHDDAVEGVVITFTDITESKRTAKALQEAKQQAELANVAKSRFLAAASHDLRQPLQTLALLQGLLAKMVVGEGAQKLVARLDQTLGAISGMLNTLLDLNQIEAGTVRTEMVNFPINDLLGRLRDEFAYHAQSQGLDLRVVPCSLSISSDPHLLEQMIRNLISNALKYTEHGKVLLGCRRHDGMLRIKVGDTGVGIPADELESIFEEYHQLDNAARERSRGLGLGLSIVQRLGKMLGHRVRVRSRPGKGSVFTIEVKLAPSETAAEIKNRQHRADGVIVDGTRGTGAIMIVEDDPEVRELLELLLKSEGHRVSAAADGIAALALAEQGSIRPDLIIADYNLPNGMDGLEVVAKVQAALKREMPVIVLTGDISTGTLRRIATQNCVQLNKPMKPNELLQAVERLLPKSQSNVAARAPRPAMASAHPGVPVIFVVDDDDQIREGIRSTFEAEGRKVEDYATCEDFLAAYHPGCEGCLLIDAYLPGMSGLELLQRLHGAGNTLPAIMITGNSDVPIAVEAMKAGAADFLEKPISSRELVASVNRALERSKDATKLSAWHEAAAARIAKLTMQQRRIMDMVLAGNPSKNIAADLGISQRTVENHRAAIMHKTGSKSLPALARLAVAAASKSSPPPR